MKMVIIESPFAGDVERNIAYARAAMKDCLLRGEAPYASHLLYTQEGVLNDLVPEERHLGIEAGLAIGDRTDATVVYTDFGLSSGMKYGIERAFEANRPVECRSLPEFAPKERPLLANGQKDPAYYDGSPVCACCGSGWGSCASRLDERLDHVFSCFLTNNDENLCEACEKTVFASR